jgi:hypothetical protein
VPVNCPVHVNEERVKLRLLQAGDHVVVEFRKEGDREVAESVRSVAKSLSYHQPIRQTGLAG